MTRRMDPPQNPPESLQSPACLSLRISFAAGIRELTYSTRFCPRAGSGASGTGVAEPVPALLQRWALCFRFWGKFRLS